MADYTVNSLLLEEDIDVVLQLLNDGNKDLETEIDQTVQNVSKGRIACRFCTKVCKSVGGRKIHVQRKHPGLIELDREEDLIEQRENEVPEEKLFTLECMEKLIKETRDKLAQDKCYPVKLRDEMKHIDLSKIAYGTLIDSSCMKFLKKGKAEKFYNTYFIDVVFNASSICPRELSNNCSTLLLTNLAEKLIGDVKRRGMKNNDAIELSEFMISEREICGLQYIAGYTVHTLYNRVKYKHAGPVAEISEVLSILWQMKGDEKDIKNAKLINVISRGGLWAVTQQAEEIFMITEKLFRQFTHNNKRLHNIDAFTKALMENIDINSIFKQITDTCEIPVDNESEKVTLQSILELYIRVRCFSFARDVVEDYKEKNSKKYSDKKGLRETLKRHSEETEEVHG